MNCSGTPNKLRHAAILSAACAYVLTGFATFHLLHAITDDADLAQLITVCLSVPLVAPLVYAIGWIEEHL
jgi:hypothetical protein